MSRLNDVIGHVIETEMDPSGKLKLHDAVEAALPMIDDEDRETLTKEALYKRIKDAISKGSRLSAAVASRSGGPRQYVLFPALRRGHPVDTDGREVVLTEEMTEMQFRRVIEIRRKQVQDDTAYLEELVAAYEAARPVWTAHPDYTFGQVCAELAEMQAVS